mgnify:CR=1 FL=1
MQIIKVGLRKLLILGVFLCGLSLTATGCLQLVPLHQTALFTLFGFAARAASALGVAMTILSTLTIISEVSGDRRTFMMVRYGKVDDQSKLVVINSAPVSYAIINQFTNKSFFLDIPIITKSQQFHLLLRV